MIDFLKKHPRDKKDIWLGCKLIIPSNLSQKHSIETYEYEGGCPEKPVNSKIVRNNRNNEIVIEIAINNYGIYQKEKMSYEAQAQSLLWHYTDTMEKEFFLLKGYEEDESA